MTDIGAAVIESLANIVYGEGAVYIFFKHGINSFAYNPNVVVGFEKNRRIRIFGLFSQKIYDKQFEV